MSGGPQRLGSHSTLGLLEGGLLDPEPASIAGAVVVGIGSLGGVGALVGGDELVWGLQATNASTNTNDILPDLTSGIVVQVGCSMPAVEWRAEPRPWPRCRREGARGEIAFQSPRGLRVRYNTSVIVRRALPRAIDNTTPVSSGTSSPTTSRATRRSTPARRARMSLSADRTVERGRHGRASKYTTLTWHELC